MNDSMNILLPVIIITTWLEINFIGNWFLTKITITIVESLFLDIINSTLDIDFIIYLFLVIFILIGLYAIFYYFDINFIKSLFLVLFIIIVTVMEISVARYLFLVIFDLAK